MYSKKSLYIVNMPITNKAGVGGLKSALPEGFAMVFSPQKKIDLGGNLFF